MTLPQIRDAYKERANRIYMAAAADDAVEPKYQKDIDACYVAANRVQLLIDQGPLPTGQEWNLQGRYMPVTVWGKKDA